MKVVKIVLLILLMVVVLIISKTVGKIVVYPLMLSAAWWLSDTVGLNAVLSMALVFIPPMLVFLWWCYRGLFNDEEETDPEEMTRRNSL